MRKVRFLVMLFLVLGGIMVAVWPKTDDKLKDITSSYVNVDTVKTVKVDQLTKEDIKQIHCLARNMYFEAAVEDQDGWIAVANVTLNRTRHPRWPNTICEVVYQPKQFSWTIKDKNTIPADKSLWGDIYSMAILVYNSSIGDITDGSVYYHADYIKTPRWVKGEKLVKVDTIGRHIFYKESK